MMSRTDTREARETTVARPQDNARTARRPWQRPVAHHGLRCAPAGTDPKPAAMPGPVGFVRLAINHWRRNLIFHKPAATFRH